MGTELVPETSDDLHVLTWLSVQENLVELCFIYLLIIPVIASVILSLETGLRIYKISCAC